MSSILRTSKLFRRPLLVVLIGLMLFGIAQLLGYFNRGADRKSMLADLSGFTTDSPAVDFNFEADVINLDDTELLKQISKQYSQALQNLSLAYSAKDTTLIADGFTSAQRSNLNELITQSTNSNSYQTQFIAHHLKFDFLSADRKIAAFTDENAMRIKGKIRSDGDFIQESVEMVTTRVIVFLEDGFWRIAHWEQLQVEPQLLSKTVNPQDIQKLSGVNYYPKDYSWDTFNPELSLEVIRKDFQQIKETGFNAIRLFIDYHDFGAAYPKSEKLARLKSTLDLAEQEDLKVVLTLFDFYGDYRLRSWPAVAKHLDKLLDNIGQHPAIHSWDIKNEPDLDFDSRGKQRTLAWLQFVANYMREKGTVQHITIGWSTAEAASNLAEVVDYVSFHYYKGPQDFQQALDQLKDLTQKEIFVQEFGLSTNRGLWAPFGNSEKDQANYYGQMLDQLKANEVSGFCWNFHDFSKVPKKIRGWKPWIKNKQANFGLLDSDGNKKAAYEIVKKKLGR